jgi:glycosyltransferase involved in cell wall biosynthesis
MMTSALCSPCPGGVERTPAEAPSSRGTLAGLRVCFVAGTLGQGGAERQLFYILQALRNAGASAKVLCLTAGESWESPIRQLGFQVTWIGGSDSRIARLVKAVREVRRFKPDVVQSQHFYVNLYGAVAARVLRCPDIGAIRSNVSSELADLGAPLGRASLRFPRLLAANSRAAVGKLISMGLSKDRLVFLPNAIDDSHFAPTYSPPLKPLTILGVGRLVPAKRFDLFLEVIGRLSMKIPIKGTIAGDGPLRGELEAMAARLGLLPDKVEFLGPVRDVARLYRHANLLLVTSDHEGTPNAVLEAMASGLPVVATSVGDVPELMDNGTRGRLAKPGDVAGMLSAITELLDAPHTSIRLAQRAREYVQSQHSHLALEGHLNRLYSLSLAI